MDGILILNKDKNITSSKAILKVKKILNLDKVGHCGTLDPDATGVLPILINKGCKLSDLFLEKEKEYIASGIFGIKTDTADISGKIIEEKEEVIPSKEEMICAINSFKGIYNQTPPMFSAIKKEGKKLYELARKNIVIEREKRTFEIYDIELIRFGINLKDSKFSFEIKVKSSKGLYVRTLIEDICEKTNNIGTLTELQRTKSGVFDLANSYTLEDIEKGQYKILSFEELFKDLEKLEVNEYLKKLILSGIVLDERQIITDKMFKVYHDKKLIAIYKPFEKGHYKPVVIV